MRVQALGGGVTRYTFDEIKRSHTVRAACTKCGKKRQRKFTADQTVNPYNRNEDGSVKTREEVARAVEAELVVMLAKPFLCGDCDAIERRKRRFASLGINTDNASGDQSK
jgi:hypothetical protein